MKKKFFLTIFLLLAFVSVLVSANTLIPYKTGSGSNLKYRGTNIDVMIPEAYIDQESDFRAVWITHLVGDFPSYQNETQYKNEVQKVFQTMEYFNMNAMIFHVRTHNNALYKSNLNPVASYYNRVNFDVFDPLEYIIEEAHKRGIEFHAWMNPYRLSTTFSGSVEQFAASQPTYNIASNPEAILKEGNSLILDPGEPMVRDFIVDTVMELIENYDIDAVHFDDYFYINGVDDTATRNKYNTENLSLGDFRRKQVDLFIEALYNEMKTYNLENNRLVQLGISPSGIYDNGSHVDLGNYRYDENGKLTYPLYSNTAGFAHYGNYLYSDTKKWIDEEWIDYIIPQTYWSFEQPVAGYAPIMDWWNAVVKYSNVNLYSGMGLYMANDSGTTYGWKNNDNEALNQVIYSSNLENVRGHSVYSYKHIKMTYDSATRNQVGKTFIKVKNEAWTKYNLLPEIRTYDSEVLGSVNNLKVEKIGEENVVSFDKLANAKYYVIYRNKSEVSFTSDERIAVFGSKDEVVKYVDQTNEDYVYGVKAMSKTNTLGSGRTAVISNHLYKIDFYVDDELVAEHYSNEVFDLPLIPTKEGYDQVAPSWNKTDFSNITENLRVDAIYTINEYTVKFHDIDGNVVEEVTVNYKEGVTPPQLEEVEGYEFIEWDTNLDEITRDLNVLAVYDIKTYVVNFYDNDGELIESFEVEYGSSVDAPEVSEIEGYKFTGWDTDFSNVKGDLEVKPIYKEIDQNPGKSIFSCKEVNLSFMLFAISFALYMFIRRKK